MMPDCIIAAAGRSSRMKVWKPSLQWGGRTVIETVVDTASAAGCRIILVCGYKYLRMRFLLRKRNEIVFVRARRWRRGMDVSIRAGMAKVKSGRFFVLPGDMPLLRSEDYLRLAGMNGGSVLRPVYRDIPGHPVLFDAVVGEKLMASPEGMPFRDVLRNFDVEEVEWEYEGVVKDLDTPEDYRNLSPST